MLPFRIGHGYDVHAFGPGDQVTIGGVSIAFDRGLVAHSDGDVALHALCDAILGAMALGDIGHLFPDTDPAFKGANSRQLLQTVISKTGDYQVGNIDLTIVAQAPKMAPHIQTMRERIAADCGIALDQVNVKATTTERLGFEGRQEGISVHAVVLMVLSS